MPPVILTLLQGLFLLLLYVFVARAVRAVLRDIRVSSAAARPPARATRDTGRSGRRDRERSRRIAPAELVIHKPEGRPQVIALDTDDLVFGRADTAAIVLADPYVSDHHARVYRDGDEWMVADLGSTNGTFLNRQKVAVPTPIAAGDQLGIGRTVVEVRR